MSTNINLEQRLLEKIRQLLSEKITEVEQLLDFLLLNQSHKTQNPENLRPFALCRGEFAVPKEFNDPLPEAILSDLEDEGMYRAILEVKDEIPLSLSEALQEIVKLTRS